MNIMETMKVITELAQKLKNIELQEKIMELREEVINLKEENIQLRAENSELKSQIDEYSNGESCPRCRKRSWVFIDSKPHPTFGDLGCLERTYKCSACGFSEKHMHDPSEA